MVIKDIKSCSASLATGEIKINHNKILLYTHQNGENKN